MNAWILAARPKTLWAAFAPVLIGSGMAKADGAFHWPSAVACLLCAMLIQIATNFWNDFADFRKGADTAARVGPVRTTQAGLITPAAMRNAACLTFLAAAFGSAYLVHRAGWPIAVIGILSIVSGILYTGGPKPLGYVGLGDIFVLVFFGPVAVAGTYFAQAITLPTEVVVAGFAPGLLATAILTVNNLRDIETDARAGKKTLAVRFGARFARVEYFLCVAAASSIPFALYTKSGRHVNALAASATIVVAVPAIRSVFVRVGRDLNPVLGYTALLLLLYSVLFTAGWLS